MASFNRVILMGNLTRDPEMRYIPSGLAVTDIGLAVNDRRRAPSGDWIDEVTFVDISLFGRQAEIACQYLTKGSPALVEGRLKLDTWETDGQKRSKLKVIGDKVVLLGSRSSGGGDVDGGGGSYSSPRSAPQNALPRGQVVQQATPSPDDYDYGPSAGEDVPF